MIIQMISSLILYHISYCHLLQSHCISGNCKDHLMMSRWRSTPQEGQQYVFIICKSASLQSLHSPCSFMFILELSILRAIIFAGITHSRGDYFQSSRSFFYFFILIFSFNCESAFITISLFITSFPLLIIGVICRKINKLSLHIVCLYRKCCWTPTSQPLFKQDLAVSLISIACVNVIHSWAKSSWMWTYWCL